MLSDWAAAGGTRTYRYGRDTYVVELVVCSRLTGRDDSVGGGEGKNCHLLGNGGGSSDTSQTERQEDRRTGGKDRKTGQRDPGVTKVLLRFAVNRIGISVTQEQQQSAAYAAEHWQTRNAWSWGR